MSYHIKYLSLQKAELQYEVELRGGSGDSVQELRKQIIKLSQFLPAEDVLESHLDPADDLRELKESLLKSQNNLSILRKQFDKNLFTRTETLLHHIYHRINRIVNSKDVTDIYKVCTSNFKSQFNELITIKQSSSQLTTSAAGTDNVSDSQPISVTCERSLHGEINKIKYSGNTCVHSFIQRVDEFVQSRGISFDKILTLAYDIFVDDALHWYRYNRDKVKTWNELCILLKEDFSSEDYDYRLAAEIRSRTQGEQENITVYLSIMHGMFSRLGKPMSEEDKLEILMHNIRPCYASTLAASPSIKSIDELKSVCRNYETVTSRFSQFQEPPKISNNTLAPEFAYKQKTNSYSNNNKFNKFVTYTKSNNYNTNINSIETTHTLENEVAAMHLETHRPMYCPRCRSNTHSLGNCRQPRFLVCFKCGKKDVRYPECPDCHPHAANSSKN